MTENGIFANSNQAKALAEQRVPHSSVSSCASLFTVGGEFAHAIKTPSEAQ